MVMAEKKAIIRINGVRKIFQVGEVEVHALRGIDLEIEEGEIREEL